MTSTDTVNRALNSIVNFEKIITNRMSKKNMEISSIEKKIMPYELKNEYENEESSTNKRSETTINYHLLKSLCVPFFVTTFYVNLPSVGGFHKFLAIFLLFVHIMLIGGLPIITTSFES